MSSPFLVNPTPDITAYTDLRPFDRTDQEIIQTALAALQLNVPELTLREGSMEVLLIESVALEIAEAVTAINRLPGAVAEAVLHLVGVDKDYGAPATATATITFGDSLGHRVPAGTRIYLPLAGGSVVTFLVEPPDLVIASGVTSGVVNLISNTNTAAGNGVAAGTALTLADPVPYIDSVVLATAVADGRDPETTDSWRDRGVATLSRLTSTLVLPRHFEEAALANVNVGRALAIDLYQPGLGHSPGADPGHITVCVLATDGTALSSGTKTAIQADLDSQAAAMLIVHVTDITVVTVAAAVHVVALPGYDTTVVQTSINQTLTAYLNPLLWNFGRSIYLNEVISLVDRVPGVDRVVTVTIAGSAADYALTDPTSLPKAGALTITVDAAP